MYLQVRNNQNMLENAKNKKIQLRSDDDIQNKILAKCSNFEVSSLGLKFQVLSLEVFDEVSVLKF